MSKYEEHQTVLTDGTYLAAALKELGFDPQVYPEAMPMIGYHGDERPERAHIIISRLQIGQSSNDIGFVKEGGTYRAIISQFDRRRFDTQWMGKLTQMYKEKQTLHVAQQKGYAFLGKTVTAEGKVVLKFAGR